MELNKKIAEWLGFKWDDDWSAKHPYKDNRGVVLHNSIDFTTSLDACFEYIVPEVNEVLDRHFCLFQSIDGWTCDIGLGDITVEDRNPALALCRAVEKLIDGGTV